MHGENDGFFIIKQIKKPRLCSVLLDLGSGNSTQEVHFFRAIVASCVLYNRTEHSRGFFFFFFFFFFFCVCVRGGGGGEGGEGDGYFLPKVALV